MTQQTSIKAQFPGALSEGLEEREGTKPSSCPK